MKSQPPVSAPASRIRRQAPAPMALEQRYMFDGAAVGEAVSKQAAPEAGLLHLLGSAQAPSAALAAAQQLAEKVVADFARQSDAGSQLFNLFSGGQTAPSAAWSAAAQRLIGDMQNGRYSVDLQLRSNLELRGAMGAFAAQGPDGRPVIYLNADWLAMGPTREAIERVLVEELGHSLDAVLNPHGDTPGDEGDAFALHLLGSTVADATRVGADDHATLLIDGVSVQVEEASVTFKALWAATPSSWSLQASSITLNNQVDAVAGSIKFISADPSAAYFAGNNVAGNLVYSDSSGVVHSIGGVISRQFKTGSATNAFYFYSTGPDGLVGGGDDQVFLVQVSVDTTPYAVNNLVRTSSDPVSTALNGMLDTGLPSVSAADSYSYGAQTAIELGTSAGRDGTGNVLDSHLATGSGLTVIAAGTSDATQAKVTGGTTASTGTSITGLYGTLKIGANGTYDYVVDNVNATVQALRMSTDTLADAFIYTVKDSSGNIVKTTLTVTIQGQNDAPVAANDYNTTKIGGTAVTGNVLSNDTDVDRGDVLSIAQLMGSATASSISNTPGGTTVTFTTSNGWSSVHVGDYVYYWNTGNSTYELLHDASGNAVTVTNTSTATLSATPTQYYTTSGWVGLSSLANAQLGFYAQLVNSTTSTSLKYIVVTSSTSAASSTFNVSSLSGLIAVGMTASGTGVAAGTTVKAVTYDSSGNPLSVTLNNTITTANNGTINFTAPMGTTLTGHYGSLVLNADGSYSYTPNGSGSGGTDVFSYTAQDLAGATSTATLNIQVLPAATTLTTVADAASITVGSASVSDNVITNLVGSSGNDSSTGGAESIISGATAGAALSVTPTIAAGGSQTIVGQYGTLSLSSSGAYTYTLNTDAASVSAFKALPGGATLKDNFQYLATNTGGAKSAALLSITIVGVNDAPTLDLSPSNTTSTGYVTTYTQGDSSPAVLVGPTGTHVADVDSTSFAKLDLSFTQASFPDGSSEQLVVNGAATTIANLGGLANGASGNFSLGGVTYGYSVGVSAGRATLSFTAGSAMSLAQVETLITALAYKNASSNPVGGAGRSFDFKVYDAGNLASNVATSTLVVYNTNAQPTVVADTASATEAGGTANGTPGTDPTGSVTANDSGSYITVTAAEKGGTLDGSASSVAASSTSANGSVVAGNYGSLRIGADGSYKYTVDNSNATVNALNTGSTPLTDTFSYQITDQNGQTATTTLTVSVHGANDAPTVVTAPTAQHATAGSAFSYTVAAFADVDTGDSISYSASGLPSWLHFDATTRTFSGTPGAAAAAQTVTVTGTDSGGLTVSTTFTIDAVNPPGPTAGADTADATEAGGVANGTPGVDPSGSVTANDTGSAITVTAAEKGGAVDGSAAGVAASSTSTSGTTLVAGSYGSLSIGADGSYKYAVDNNNATVQALNVGGSLTDTFSYRITDAFGQTATTTLTVTVHGANDAPVASSPANQSMAAGQTQTYTVPAFTDVDNPTLSYSATLADGTPLPSWVSFNTSTRQLSFSPTSANVGSFSFKVTGSDGSLSASANFSLTVVAAGGLALSADTADATEAGGVANGTPGTDPSGNVLSNDTGTGLFVNAIQQGATLSDASSVSGGSTASNGGTVVAGLYGSLSIGADGSFKYTVDNSLSAVQALNVGDTLTEQFAYQGGDSAGHFAATTLTITLHGANDAPTVPTAPADQHARVGSAFSYTLPAFADVDAGDTISYSASGLPAWASFDPNTRQFSGTPGSASTAQTITVTGTDSHGATVTTSFLLDAVNPPAGPTLSISADHSALKAGETALLSFTLSAAPGSNAFDLADVSVSGGSLSNFQQIDATHYTAVFTPATGSTASGVINVAAAGFNDGAGIDASASNTVTLSIDTQPPAAPGVGLTHDTGLSGSDRISNDPSLSLSGVEPGAAIQYSHDGVNWSSSYTASEGSNTVYVRQTDAAGNVGPSSAAYSFTLDTQPPSISVSSDKSALKAGDTALLSFTLSETPGSNAFVLGDIGVSGGTLSNFQQIDATHYTAVFTPTAGSTAHGVINVGVAQFNDVAGNDATASNTVTLSIDTQPPVAPGVGLTHDTGLSGSDRISNDPSLSLSGVEPGATVQYSHDGVNWSSSYTASEGSNTVYVRQTDAAGNVGPSSTAYSFMLDTQPPSISVSSDKSTLKAGDTALLSFTLSETPGSNAFVLGDIGVSGGTLSNFQQIDATHYTAVFTPTAGSTLTGTVSVSAAQFNDVAGNDASASNTVTLGVDTQMPPAPDVSLRNDSGRSGGDLVTNDGTLHLGGLEPGATVEYSRDGIHWSSGFTPAEGANTVYVRQTDPEGNVSPSSGPLSFTLDTQPPTVSISSDKSALKVGDTALLSFTLSEAPGSNAFMQSDVSVSGGTLSNFRQIDATHYTAVFTPTAGSTVSGAIRVTAAQFNDVAGNDSTASNTVTLRVDTQPPATPAVDSLVTVNAEPTLSGHFPSTDAAGGLQVSVGGRTYVLGVDPALTVQGDVWTLNLAVAQQRLDPRTYEVTATVFDAAGNRSSATGQAVVNAVPLPQPPAPVASVSPPAAPVAASAPVAVAVVAERAPQPVPVVDTRPPPVAVATGVSDVLTSNGSDAMRIPVLKSDTPALLVFNGVPDQSFDTGSHIRFRLPPDAFTHTNESAVVHVHVERVDGGGLPEWLHFNPTSGEFDGNVPMGAPTEIAVKVTARDEAGREAMTIFRLKLRPGEGARLPGRVGLSQQLQQISRHAIALGQVARPEPVRTRDVELT